MTNIEDGVVARLKAHGETFEILVDPDKAYNYRAGDEKNLEEVLLAEFVFKDAGKGDKASEESLQKAFETTNQKTIADKILHKGDIQLTSEKKREMLEDKRKQVVSIIARNAINPQTKTPHPPDRIGKAMEEAKVHIELQKSAKEQVDLVVKAIRPILPITFETIQLAIKIPGKYSGSLYQLLHEYGEVKKEEWKGEFQFCVLEVPGGIQDEVFSQLNNRTHGEVEVKKIEKK